MPITNETILEANRKMLCKTNRAILFARVNMDEYLDPESAPEDQEPDALAGPHACPYQRHVGRAVYLRSAVRG